MKLYLIRGLPGSGKSTYAKSLGILHLEADQYHMRDGKYAFDPTKIKEAHLWCQLMVRSALGIGMDVVVSNTFTQKWEMDPYLLMAKEFGAKVEVFVATGQYGNIHDVPAEVMRKMAERWEE